MLSAVVLLGACGGPVTIPRHRLDDADERACRAFVDDLPRTLAGEDAVEVEPDDALGAAYGDPAIVVICGVPVPDGFDQTSTCDEADGVGWYAPDDERDDRDLDLDLTAAGWTPRVTVRVPPHYRPSDPRAGEDTAAAVLSELAPAIKTHLTQVDACD